MEFNKIKKLFRQTSIKEFKNSEDFDRDEMR